MSKRLAQFLRTSDNIHTFIIYPLVSSFSAVYTLHGTHRTALARAAVQFSRNSNRSCDVSRYRLSKWPSARSAVCGPLWTRRTRAPTGVLGCPGVFANLNDLKSQNRYTTRPRSNRGEGRRVKVYAAQEFPRKAIKSTMIDLISTAPCHILTRNAALRHAPRRAASYFSGKK